MPGILLKSLRYSEMLGKPKHWTLDGLELGPINLLVGKNATGKTRTLNVIANMARQFVPEQKFRSQNGSHEFVFDNNGQRYEYIVHVEEAKVTREEVIVDGDSKLERGSGGYGKIFNQEEGKKLRFRPPEDELAVAARRDSLQHPFLEPLHEWAEAVRHYTFGATLGKDHVVISVKGGPETDDRDSNQVVGIFRKAVQKFGQAFKDAVIADMAEMGYEIEEIGVYAPENIKILRGGLATELLVLGVKERGIGGVVEQGDMSQGMFRALSILIQVNYSQIAKRANCILIDDIGEGLDFERSTALIEILRRKAQAAEFQLVMTTNDRFVMNKVPLEEWSILQRNGCEVQVRNYANSRKHFDAFKFMGLNNFDFLRYDFINEDPDEVFEEAGAGKK